MNPIKINSSKKRKVFFYLLFPLFLFISNNSSNAQFIQIAGANGLDDATSGAVNGQAWGDLNNDGNLDVIFPSQSSGNNVFGKLFLNDGPPNYTFSDSTSALIDGFNDADAFGRQMLIVDFNNDGYNDILRGFGGGKIIEIYFNDGPPNYTFGDASQQPDIEIGSPPTGEWNTEGVVAVDWNQDGWLDIIVDNDGGGNDVYENDQAGGFDYVIPGTGAGQTGFPASHAGDGDYITAADIDDNGYVDLYGRKTSVSNYWWFNPATSQFETQANPNIVSDESDKGGTMFCDFDGDADLDLFWTSNGVNQIWRNDGGNVWTATGIPAAPYSTMTDIDGCDCGDIDNDGDIDIFMGASSGYSYILENHTPSGGTLSFTMDSLNISGNSESTTFTDFDNDGDLDLYAIIQGSENQLWENTTNNLNYLYVNALYDNGNASTRDAIGANVLLTNCIGDTAIIKQVNGGKGHGSQHQKKVHFGVDPFKRYIVEVHYVYKNGTRSIVKKAVIPNELTNLEVTILDTDANDFTYCNDIDYDNIPDEIDIDDDNDGIPDVVEICGVGATDFSCLSSILHDGSNNPLDPNGDEDNDGTLNYLDANDPDVTHASCTDNNNDGVCDSTSSDLDADGDGIPNSMDKDADNDGIPDLVEAGGVDTDGDGLVDGRLDSDEDGIPDTVDSDNPSCVGGDGNTPPDGICDDMQGGTDTDGDGIQDTDDIDADNDGLSDPYDTSEGGTAIAHPDSDNDGIPDTYDLDADNDGIPDVVEAGGTDVNGDGIADNFTDTDNDGFNDVVDGDVGNDGIENSANALQLTGPDTDNDGIPNSYPEGDNDNDGVLDQNDLDADNDGIPDVVEAGGTDINGDGIADGFTDTDGDGFNDIVDGDPNNSLTAGDDSADTNTNDALVLTGADSDNDGQPNSFPEDDTDGDGILDHLDLDADNDGIPDVVEAGGTDNDGDGIADNYADIDGDGYNDVVDGDPDNSLTTGDDSDDSNTNDALVLTGTDTNGDGRPNSFPEDDTDGDGILDHLDLDADNDGIQDIIEAGGSDANGDGYADNYDPNTGAYTGGGDSDGDGFSNYYDSDADNDGTSGDAGTDPLITTTTDGNGDGSPDNGMIEGDLDNDGIPNHLDLDADNDGILDVVEAGVADTDNDGIADDALTNDSDGNGWSNTYDGENGGTEPVSTTDSDSDGYPDSYDTQNEDTDGQPNFLDIDADNDGIVDNTEGQPTNGYVAPDNNDTDNDGIDDAYDSTNGFGGEGITPENTDMTDNPDYLDTDTDNDGELDTIEGHDTNGDGVIDGSDAPRANTGLPGGSTDSDGDGLLDGYDNDLVTDATNNALEPSLHPDEDDPGVDQDWRQGVCELCKMRYAVQDGAGTQTTNYLYNPTTKSLQTSSNVYGVIRTNRYCKINGWRYYYNPANPAEALFAMQGDSLDLDRLDYIEIQVGQFEDDREAGSNNDSYTRIMNRDWFVKMNSAISNTIDIRFYYPGTDFGNNGYQKADINADSYNLTNPPDIKWFKVPDWDTFDPTMIEDDGANLANMPNYLELDPVAQASTASGNSETDGSAATVGNGKNYVQFDDLTSFSGGTAVWAAGNSLLPVDLQYFEGAGDGCNTVLNWASETEESFSHFELEWSGNGQSFQKIEVINAEGGNDRQFYQLTDTDASHDNYYRLKMVDTDGSFKYSDVLYIKTNCEEEYDIAVYPNPIYKGSKAINIKFFAEREDAQLIITSITGQVVKQLNLNNGKEWNTVQADISDLPSGSYFIKILGAKGSKTFIIQE